MGPDLQIVVLDMSLEEQMERIRGRHEGNQDAVQMMKVPTFGPIYYSTLMYGKR